MPRKDLPRYSIAITLSEEQLSRLDEITNQQSAENPQGSNELTIMMALAAFDVLLKAGRQGVALHGETVFHPLPSDV